MEVDQRAWLEYEKQPTVPGGDVRNLHFESGQPINFPFWMKNVGKTPAKNIDIKVFVDILDASEEPPLTHVSESSKYPHEEIVIGIGFPDEDYKQIITRRAENRSPLLVTDAEVAGIREGTKYFVVYGIATYDDIFGYHHWTQFCDWVSSNGSFKTVDCTQFNSVDKE